MSEHGVVSVLTIHTRHVSGSWIANLWFQSGYNLWEYPILLPSSQGRVKSIHVMLLGPRYQIRTTRRNFRVQFSASCGSNIDITCGCDSHVVLLLTAQPRAVLFGCVVGRMLRAVTSISSATNSSADELVQLIRGLNPKA